jgi:hypothetical protein
MTIGGIDLHFTSFEVVSVLKLVKECWEGPKQKYNRKIIS